VLTNKFSNCILFTSVADKFFIYSVYVYSSTFRQDGVKNKNMHLPNNRPQIIYNSRLTRTNNFLLIQYICICIYIFFFPTFAANSYLLTNKSKIVTYHVCSPDKSLKYFFPLLFNTILKLYFIHVGFRQIYIYIYIYIFFFFPSTFAANSHLLTNQSKCLPIHVCSPDKSLLK